jgi:nucleoside-diphosphate-sugar epimerase
MKYELPLISSRTSIKNAIHIIERSGFDEALIVTEDGVFLGGVLSTDLRRLLISGVNEADEVGAYPPKYTISLSDEDLRNEHRLEAILADLRLSGVHYVPIVAPAGTVRETISVDDLETRLGKPASVKAEADASKTDASKTVLVAGGAGYLGSVLTRKLLAKGYTVRVLDSFIYGRRALDEIASNDRLEIVEGDMRNIHTCVAALEGVHGVVLLAAIVGDPASKVRPTETIETNVLATQALASACKLQNIARFLYASTCSVYGVGADLLDEDSPLNPVSLYARTKIASEKIILDMGDDYFCPTILRMGTLYGYSSRMRFDLVVNTMAMKAFTDRKIHVFGGRQWRPLLNVEDAADVYLACLEADIKDVGNQVFNVGSNEQNYQIDEIARLVSGSLGDVPIERDESSLDARDYRVSFEKIQTAVGFRPRHSIENSAKTIYDKLDQGIIRDPAQKIYYNHYFDSSEE